MVMARRKQGFESAGRIEMCQWRRFIRDQRSSVIVTVAGSLIGTALLISGTVKLQAEIEAFLGMMPTSRGVATASLFAYDLNDAKAVAGEDISIWQRVSISSDPYLK